MRVVRRTEALRPTPGRGDPAGVSVETAAGAEHHRAVVDRDVTVGEDRAAAQLQIGDTQIGALRHVFGERRPPAHADLSFQEVVDGVECAAWASSVEQQLVPVGADDPLLGAEQRGIPSGLQHAAGGADLDRPAPRVVVRFGDEREAGPGDPRQIIGQFARRRGLGFGRRVGQDDRRARTAVRGQLEGPGRPESRAARDEQQRNDPDGAWPAHSASVSINAVRRAKARRRSNLVSNSARARRPCSSRNRSSSA